MGWGGVVGVDEEDRDDWRGSDNHSVCIEMRESCWLTIVEILIHPALNLTEPITQQACIEQVARCVANMPFVISNMYLCSDQPYAGIELDGGVDLLIARAAKGCSLIA